MATCLFRSALAFRLQSFLEMRQATGRRCAGQQKILRYLDRFLTGQVRPGGTITRRIAQRWITSMEPLSIGTRINRVCMLRQFCVYLAYFEPKTFIIPRCYLPRRTHPAPHIYSIDEVRRILAAAKRMGPPGSIRPAAIQTLIGLLYSTGLRIGEALRLNLGEVDLKRRLLLIRQSKFRKSRYVPLSASSVRQLQLYLNRRRNLGLPTSIDAPLFVNLWWNRYGHAGVTTVFLKLLRQIGVRGPMGQPGPRIHDFRHTFAVNRILAWYRQGANVSAKLPLLSTYLGHSTVTGTQLYLHATAELLESANRRFHSRCAVPKQQCRDFARRFDS